MLVLVHDLSRWRYQHQLHHTLAFFFTAEICPVLIFGQDEGFEMIDLLLL